jgi:hypothetical protein
MSTIITYHGSNVMHQTLAIGKEFSTYDISELSEGYGLYMAEKREDVNPNFKYVHTVFIDDSHIGDFTNKTYAINMLEALYKNTVGTAKLKKPNIAEIVDNILTGYCSVIEAGRELMLHLDSDENFHKLPNARALMEQIPAEWGRMLLPVIKYYNKDYKANHIICHKDPNVLTVIVVETIDTP